MILKENSVLKLWNYLKGNPSKFSLQSRIYNSVCIATILVMAYNITFCFSTGLIKAGVSSIVFLLLQIYLYYLSRFKNKLNISLVRYSIIINIFLSLDYYFSSGIQGATLSSFIMSYFLIIAVIQKKHYRIWTAANITLVLSLVLFEYYHPEIIHLRYTSRGSQFFNITSTYIITILLIYAFLSYIINNYTFEKNLANQNAAAIQRLNKETNKLLSIVSHDFSSPLRNIQMYLNILKKVDLSPDERKGFESELQQSTSDTMNLLNNLLSWTRQQMDGFNFSRTPVEIKHVLQETINFYEKSAINKNISFNCAIDPGVQILANAEMFRIVIHNLINNALKFTAIGGAIQISSLVGHTGHILKISDNGIGIDTAVQKDIFSLNIESTYGTNKEKGVGLGLVLCRELIQAQGGEIWFESEPGRGTTFYVQMPLA